VTPASATTGAAQSGGIGAIRFPSPGLGNAEQLKLPRFHWSGSSGASVDDHVRISRRFDIPGVSQVGRVSIGFQDGGEFTEQSDTRRIQTQRVALRVRTMYKKKKDKVRPVDVSTSDGTKPGGTEDWHDKAVNEERRQGLDRPRSYHDRYLTPKFSDIPRGSRLTPERIATLKVGEDMTKKERELLLEMLFNREKALAWAFEEIGRIHPEVAPPQEIKTIDHTPWQVPNFKIPRSLTRKLVDMLKERVKRGTLERCEGPYRNPIFLVGKKDKGDFRLINAAMHINRVTRRDSNLPPEVDEFSERFAGMRVVTLADWFSGYDQVELKEECRDLTGFMTPIGLLRMTTLPQGATNSVGQFVRIANKILEEVSDIAGAFVDDIGVEGPKTDYDGEETEPGIRRYILEHIQNIDRTLCEIERAGATVSGAKTQWCQPGVKIVGFVCDKDGRHPESSKVAKILDWPECQNTTELKGFLGLCGYYRIWILGFAIIAMPLYALTRKNVIWYWTDLHSDAMATLKIALTTAPALVTISYADGAGRIILVFDASKRGWGAVIMQEDKDGKRHPARYEGGVWSAAESKYDAGKLECRAMLKALKKFRHWLYGTYFYVETDANTLVAQLNRSATDLPGALVTQWLAWIRLFDFEVKHIEGKKNVVADALSRRRPTAEEVADAENEQDIDEWVTAKLFTARVRPLRAVEAEVEDGSISQPGAGKSNVSGARPDVAGNELDASASDQSEGADDAGGGAEPYLDAEGGSLTEGEYGKWSRRVGAFLLSGGQRPNGMSVKQFRLLRRQALNFMVRDGHLFRRPDKVNPVRRVIDSSARRNEILRELHDDSGHRGREGTYRRVADRYWWQDMWQSVKKYVKSCEECQRRATQRQDEELHPTSVDRRWEKVAVDVTNLPKCQGKQYLVVARSDLSGWVEARALASNDSRSVAAFLYEDLICRHGVFQRLVVDGGPENKALVDELAKRYGIRRLVVSAYHPQANGMVERGHKPIVDALSKMTHGGYTGWIKHLPAVLWADRTTVRASTGLTPYEFEYANRPMLPIELKYPTWGILHWKKDCDESEVIALRARALECRDEDLEEAKLYLRRAREKNAEYHDAQPNVRHTPLQEGDLVLLFRAAMELDMSRSKKLAHKWLGPYVIQEAFPDKGTYILREPHGARLRGTFAANRIKKFHTRADADYQGEDAAHGLVGAFEDTIISEDDGTEQDDQTQDEAIEEDEEEFNNVPQDEPPRRPRIEVVIPPWLGSPLRGRTVEPEDE
jgi:hypothetical protein